MNHLGNWRNGELGNFITLKRGFDLPQQKREDGQVPIFSSSGITGTHSTAMVNAPGVITGRYGTIGEVFYAAEDFWPLNTTLFVEDFHGNDAKFIYYFLKTLEWSKFTSASAVPGINRNTVHKETVSLPDIETQRRIASTLSMLDEKIKTNTEINDNLYAQAKATTKQWISKSTGDYELLPLSDIASINPDTYSPKETWKYVNYLDTSSITEGCITEIQHITPSSEKLPSRARRKIAPNDIVFSTVRPNQRHYGIISEPLPNMLGSTGFAVIRSKNPLVCNELIYLCLTENEFIEKMQQLAEQSTSTFPSIKPSDLGVCEIPCPKDQSSTSFTETLKSLFALIAANQRENIFLSEIRDALLPKLMSGEIDVSDINL